MMVQGGARKEYVESDEGGFFSAPGQVKKKYGIISLLDEFDSSNLIDFQC